MKEYRIQLFVECGKKWVNLSYFVKHPFYTEAGIQLELEEQQREHPKNIYRIITRDVTEWETLDGKEV